MTRRRNLTAVPIPSFFFAACFAFLGTASLSARAQDTTPKPITSLPKAPGDTTPTPAPTPDTATPGYIPQPITSLPKPPAPPPPLSPPPAEKAPVPVPVPAPVPAPAVEATPTAPAPAPVQPEQPAPAPPPTLLAPITPAPDAAPPAPHVPEPPPPALQASTLAPPDRRPVRMQLDHIRPFSAVGIQLKAGFAGAGIDIAIPVLQRVNLRAGGSFFQYSGSYYIDGMTINGEVKFRSGTASIDIFPFGNRFRISPGVTVYNGNNINAATSVPGGQNFDLGGGTYQSSPTDPVHGTASMTFGKRTAPNITLGFGNMVPRRNDRHWSVPFEIGMQYIDNPKIAFDLQGTVCNSQGCAQIQTDPTAQADLQQEQTDINNAIHFLRFYPIMSIGVAYKFGGSYRSR